MKTFLKTYISIKITEEEQEKETNQFRDLIADEQQKVFNWIRIIYILRRWEKDESWIEFVCVSVYLNGKKNWTKFDFIGR